MEIRGITWATLAQPSVLQHGDCGWITAEEVEPPSIWPTTLDPIEEGAMAVIQQMPSEDVAMTIRNETLTRQRDRPQLNVVPERQV